MWRDANPSLAERRISRFLRPLALLATFAAAGALASDRPLELEQIRPLALDPFFLSNRVSQSVTVEVDWVEGARPHDDALDFIRTALQEQLPAGKSLSIDWGGEIPLSVWQQDAELDSQQVSLLSPHIKLDPDGWEESEPLYVLYVPGDWGFHGWSNRIPVQNELGAAA